MGYTPFFHSFRIGRLNMIIVLECYLKNQFNNNNNNHNNNNNNNN